MRSYIASLLGFPRLGANKKVEQDADKHEDADKSSAEDRDDYIELDTEPEPEPEPEQPKAFSAQRLGRQKHGRAHSGRSW